MWEIRTEHKILFKKTQTRYHLENSDDRMMIKRVLKKQDKGYEMDSGGLK